MKRKYTEREKAAFRKFAREHAPGSSTARDCVWSFAVGGLICTLGQGLHDMYVWLGAQEGTAKVLVPVSLVLLSCVLTGLGIYEKIAAKAGAGTLVPITGFANAVCACAIDGKSEGYIKGIGPSMFKIAGPVITYGIFAGWVFGIVEWLRTVI